MGDLTILLALGIGILIGGVAIYLWKQAVYVSKSLFQKEVARVNELTNTITILEQKLAYQKADYDKLQTTLQQSVHANTELTAAKQSLHEGYSRIEAHSQHQAQRLKELSEEINYKDQQLERLREATVALRTEIAELSAEHKTLLAHQSEQEKQLQSLNEKAHLEFEKIATEILKERTERFTQSNKTNLDALLKPLSENIEGFKKTLIDTHVQEVKDRATLESKITELIKQTNQVSEQANNLATALKGQVKKQGNWGEMILESILEQSGLIKDQHYFLQTTIKDPSGKQLRPDVLIKLPDARTIIVDSKVSLIAYDRYVAASSKEAQEQALKEHLQSMYQHIEQLHSKHYDQIEQSLDFTMLFVPIEPAYLLGIQADQTLWAHAYSKRILLISPTNLIACLKLMDDLWKREMQSRSAMDIVKQGEKIYEKLVGFTSSMQAVGDQLNKAQVAYDKAFNQMKSGRGNLIDQAMRLKSMGLKSSKQFSESLIEQALEDAPNLDNHSDLPPLDQTTTPQ